MKEVILEGRCMTSREAAQEQLQEKLALPSYYGRKMDWQKWYGSNLDALWDCLTECPETVVVFRHPGAMLSALREYGCRLLQTFFEAERENPALHVVIGNHSASETEGCR